MLPKTRSDVTKHVWGNPLQYNGSSNHVRCLVPLWCCHGKMHIIWCVQSRAHILRCMNMLTAAIVGYITTLQLYYPQGGYDWYVLEDHILECLATQTSKALDVYQPKCNLPTYNNQNSISNYYSVCLH